MGTTGGVGGSTGPQEPMPGVGGVSGGSDPNPLAGLLTAKVSNLAQLKSVLIQYLGEQDGTKFYNQFMQSMAETSLSMMQQTAQANSDEQQQGS